MELVNNSKTHALLQAKLQELGHANAQIRFLKSEQTLPRATPPPAPAPQQAPPPPPKPESAPAKTERAASSPNAEDFKNDPLIQKALEMFKGQIVDVRT
jgi:hypothetical protein